MSQHSVDVLLFVEDPGAANYIACLPEKLASRGLKVLLWAAGYAHDYLLQHGLSREIVTPVGTEYLTIRELRPRVVIVGTSENPDTLGLALIEEARALGIPAIGVVDAYANAAYRFRGRSDLSLCYAPDWLLVPDEWTKSAYLALGYPSNRIKVCGHPHYDAVRETFEELAAKDRYRLRRALFPGLKDNQKVVIFVAEVSTGLNPEQYLKSADYTLNGWGLSRKRTEIVLEEFLEAARKIKHDLYLVLRLHPKNSVEEFTPYLAQFDLISQKDSPLPYIYAADLVVGLTSMLLVEATILQRPTLSIVPRREEKEWLPTVVAGLAASASTRGELQTLLPALLKGGGRTQGSAGSFFPEDSLRQILNFIQTLLAERLATTSS